MDAREGGLGIRRPLRTKDRSTHLGDEVVEWSNHLRVEVAVVLLLQVVRTHVHHYRGLVLVKISTKFVAKPLQ